MKLILNTLVSFWAVAVCLSFPAFESPVQAKTTAELGWRFEYDDADRLTKVTDTAGRDTRLQYTLDNNKRLRKIVRSQSDNSTVQMAYDERGRRSTMTDGNGVVSYIHNDLDRLSRVQRQGAPAITYTYDTMARIKSLQVGDFYSIEYSYDFLGRLTAMKTPYGVIEYEYVAGQGEVIRKLPNGIWTIWTYEPNGELRQIKHGRVSHATGKSKNWTPIADYTYQYRPDGLIEAIGEGSSNAGQFSVVSRYEYDTVGRLTRAARSDGQTHHYEYDLVGNRLKAVSAGRQAQTCTYDWFGRVMTLNDTPCSHDTAGNLTSLNISGTTMNYRHNLDGQLMAVGEGKVGYRYDGDGRLIVRKAGGTETIFIPDPLSPYWQPLVMDSREGGRTLVIWDRSIPLILIRDGKPAYLLHDHLGSVRIVADELGKINQRIDYDPFGVIENPETEKEFAPRFTGIFWDPEARAYLMFARTFSPYLGRFLQIDPYHRIPSSSQKDIGFYLYCGNDPMNFRDLDGTTPQSLKDIYWSSYYAAWYFAQMALKMYSDYNVFLIGQALNVIGTGSYWIGANKSGALFSWTIDSKGRFPLGDTEIGTINRWDEAGKWHDIQDYVNIHAEKGTEVRVPWGNDQFKYVVSRGELSKAHDREVIKYAVDSKALFPITDSPSTSNPIDLDVIRAQFPVSNAFSFLNPSPIIKFFFGGANAPWGPFEGGGPGAFAKPSPVGGVFLSGAAKLLDGVGLLDGASFDANNNLILIGQGGDEIKLPPLRLDDVVTVFRSVYINGEGPTVTIDPNPENPRGSAMIIRHSEATEETYVGWIMYQADRLMKGYNLGTDNLTTGRIQSNVSGYAEVLDEIYFGGGQAGNAREGGNWERFWIVPAEARRFEGAARELTLFDVPLNLRTQPMKWQNGKLVDDTNRNPSKGATAFTKWFTSNFDALAQEQFLTPPPESGINKAVPVFTELRRIALLTAIAEKLRDQGIPIPFWMRDYKVQPVPFERTTPAIEISRSNQRMTARIFGGVSLSPANSDVKIFRQNSDLTKLPPDQQATARMALDRSVSLAGVVRKEMTDANPLKVKTFTFQGAARQAVSLPGAETRALAPCKLVETDLVISAEGGNGIGLVRRYNSFFNPDGLLGKGWTMDLPRLVEAKVPLERDGQGGVKYRTDREVMTPLNSLYERFSRIAPVPELSGSRLLVPDRPGAFLALADANPDFVNIPTQKLIHRDGENWHFRKTGDLVATERNGFLTVYERNGDGSIKRIVGLQGRRLVASIEFKYDAAGRLQEATGQKETGATASEQDKTTISYEYDTSGRLNKVRSKEGCAGYRYEGDHLVAELYQEPDRKDKKKPKEKIVRRFEYNLTGQLLAEIAENGNRTEYHVVRDQAGSTLTIAQSGNKSNTDFIRYDAAFRPVEVRYADGTKASWTYPGDGSSAVKWTQADGETFRFSKSSDQRQRILESDKQGRFVGEYDHAGRLTSLSQNGRLLLRQEWLPDGRLHLASAETCAAQRSYDQDGLLSVISLFPPEEQGKIIHFQEIKLDSTGRPKEITDHSGLQMLMEYDASGELGAMITRKDGKNFGFQITRDKAGRIQSVESSWGKQRCSYDPEGFPAKLEIEKNGQNGFAEWKSGLLQKARQFDGGEFYLNYHEKGNNAGLISKMTNPNSLSLEYKYDETRRLSDVSVGNLFRIQPVYDDRGRLSALTYADMIRY